MEFRCRNLSVFKKVEKIVDDISISVKEGEILGVLGHEVSGKTLLLSALSGRYPLFDGTIEINGTAQEYVALSRNTALVTAHPLFLPTLTVRETLEFAAYLRLPTDLPSLEKLEKIHAVERVTGLSEIAAAPSQLCTTYDQKRLAIACELFQTNNVLLIDEPFSGLSYNDAFKMTSLLTSVAKQMRKAIVFTLSSPMSHVINKCSKIVFLNHGRAVYNGTSTGLNEFLHHASLPTPAGTSPTEHLMNLLGNSTDNEITESGDINKTALVQLRRGRIGSPHNEDLWLHEDTSIGNKNGGLENGRICKTDETTIDVGKHTPLLSANKTPSTTHWPQCRTSYWNQLTVLTSRNFKNARRRILFPVSVIQNLYILVLCILIWWRPERSEETIKDRMGLFFFTVVQWAFFSLLDAILTFPKEMRVILDERTNKLYQTSAYCISKTISEIPLAIIQPCVYMIVIYWVANLNGLSAFFASMGVLIVDVLAAQSIGLFVGVALNPPWTISVVSLGLLSMMLWGGAFCTPPVWLRWGKYASYFTYGLNALITLEFQNANPIRCSSESMVPVCNTTHPATNQTITHFPSEFVLVAQNITWSVMDDVIVLIAIGLVTRVLWYFLLRLK